MIPHSLTPHPLTPFQNTFQTLVAKCTSIVQFDKANEQTRLELKYAKEIEHEWSLVQWRYHDLHPRRAPSLATNLVNHLPLMVKQRLQNEYGGSCLAMYHDDYHGTFDTKNAEIAITRQHFTYWKIIADEIDKEQKRLQRWSWSPEAHVPGPNMQPFVDAVVEAVDAPGLDFHQICFEIRTFVGGRSGNTQKWIKRAYWLGLADQLFYDKMASKVAFGDKSLQSTVMVETIERVQGKYFESLQQLEGSGICYKLHHSKKVRVSLTENREESAFLNSCSFEGT